MTDTTDLGTIWVVGQRRAPGGTFPSGGSGGGAGDDGWIHQNEVSMEDPNPPSQIDPCADPDGPRGAADPNPPQPAAVGPEVNPDAQPCP